MSDMIHYTLKASLKLHMGEIGMMSYSSLPKSLLCLPTLPLRLIKTGDHDFTRLPRDFYVVSECQPHKQGPYLLIVSLVAA